MRKLSRKLLKRVIIGLVLFFLLYVILGATLPFTGAGEVSEDYAKSFNVSDYYGEEECTDRVMLIETNGEALDERIRLINTARESICLSTFDFRADEGGMDMLAMLQNAADRGVNIRILVDGFSGLSGMEGKNAFYALSSHDNVEIKLYNKPNLFMPWTVEGRMHDKYIIADDQAYILGGRNMRNYFLGYYQEHLNHDRDLLVYNTAYSAGMTGAKNDNNSSGQGSSLYVLSDYFEDIWALDCCRLFHDSPKLADKRAVRAAAEELRERYAAIASEKSELFEEYDYMQNTMAALKVSLLSNPTHIMSKDPTVFHALSELMKSASEDVLIHTPYVICNSYMYEELEELCDMVPNVRILLNAPEGGANIFGCSDYLQNKDKLLELGLKIYEYNGDYSFHAKSVMIDDRLSIVGSFNFDMRSVYLDTELMLVVDCAELNMLLRETSKQYENSSRFATGVDEYTLPEGYEEGELSFGRNILLRLIGFVMKPFRFLL